MAATLTSAGVIHLTAVLPALLIGAFVLARKKGTPVMTQRNLHTQAANCW